MATDGISSLYAEKLRRRAGHQTAATVSEERKKADRPCVLVVDDEPEITRSVAELLEPDVCVLTATSVDEALERLADHEVTVVLTDQRMPGGTGAELLARALRISPETTRILFTGYSDISAVIEAVNEGQVYRYVTKPWHPEELRSIVSQGLERYRLVTENRRLLEELTKANLDLEVAARELREIVYSLSHDMRTPLRALDGFSLTVLEDYGDVLDEAGVDQLRRIRSASQRMGRLFDALISLARTGNPPVELSQVDVGELATQVVARLREAEPARVVEVSVQEGMTARTDPYLVRVVLDRVLDNAWKFTASREVAHIEVGSRELDGEQVFSVRDDGVGFNDDYAHKLFTPFERLHRPEEYEGVGIGLAIVRRTLDRLGGRAWAEGTPGEGAVVWFTLGKAER